MSAESGGEDDDGRRRASSSSSDTTKELEGEKEAESFDDWKEEEEEEGRGTGTGFEIAGRKEEGDETVAAAAAGIKEGKSPG